MKQLTEKQKRKIEELQADHIAAGGYISRKQAAEILGYVKKKKNCTYSQQDLINAYIKESKKAKKLLGIKEVRNNENLASYTTYNNRGLNIAKLREIAGGKKSRNLNKFCHDCAENKNCQYKYNLDNCPYYKEVEINV